MALSDRLKSIIKPVVEDLEYEFVGLEYHPHASNALVRIYIDEPDAGIGLEDCERVSREVAAVLDVDDPISSHYSLEVSSPGMDRPLFEAEHFARFAGETAKVTLTQPVAGRRKLKGTIESVAGDDITIRVDDMMITFEHQMVVKARLVPNFGD